MVHLVTHSLTHRLSHRVVRRMSTRLAFFSLLAVPALLTAKVPNIVWIVADDMSPDIAALGVP